MKKISILTMILWSLVAVAELASWGMTENQYKMPNFATKMGEIGAQAAKQNWLLKVTAPKGWHNNIRAALNEEGARDVQVTFKDSLYNSIAISAVKGAKIAQISASSNNGVTVQKQVVIEKPEIDTEIEAPDFGDTSFKNNTDELLENIGNLEIEVPTTTNGSNTSKPDVQKAAPVAKAVEPPKPTVTQTTAAATTPTPSQATAKSSDENREINKELLRKRHARTKRVEKILSYASIKDKDELFIKDSVVLIKRFINQGVVLYFWMKESYDPAVHKLVEKGSGKYMKDITATAGVDVQQEAEQAAVAEAEAKAVETNLDFVAVDTDVNDQDDLRRMHARNKGVEINIKASQLKPKDVLYVQNKTVLVQRPLTSSQNAYFWLVGETTISGEVKKSGKNKFKIL